MGKNKYICKHCGKEYLSYKQNSQFCSRKCRNLHSRVSYNCDCCNQKMLVYQSKYNKRINGDTKYLCCSKECFDILQTTKVTKICEYCGKEYKITKAFEHTQRFCSKNCYYSHINNHKKRYLFKCLICGKEFTTRYSTQKYCSKACSGIAQRKRSACVCDYCGQTFERINSEVAHNKRHYCSKECMTSDMFWNPKDLEVLRNNYGKIENKEIQLLLSKYWTINAIKRKAQQIGVGKDRRWSREEEVILIQNYHTKSMSEIRNLLCGRSLSSILGKARVLNLKSKQYIESHYSDKDVQYLTENYLFLSDEELSQNLEFYHSPKSIHLKLYNMGFTRQQEIQKNGYRDLNRFIRQRLSVWKQQVKELHNYTCCVTGSHSDIVVHHCRGFNLLMEETIDALNFQIKDSFSEYTDDN